MNRVANRLPTLDDILTDIERAIEKARLFHAHHKRPNLGCEFITWYLGFASNAVRFTKVQLCKDSRLEDELNGSKGDSSC